MKTKMKKQTRQIAGLIGIAGIAVGILAIGGILPAFSGLNTPLAAAPTITPGEPVRVPPIGKCPPGSVEDVTVKLSAINAYTGAATGGTHRYKINDGAAQTVSDAGTFTTSAGATLDILWGNGASTDTNYSDVSTVILSCDEGAPIITRKLYENTTLTLDVFNENGNLIATENETVGAGDVVTLVAKLRAAYQKAAPYGGVMVVEYNNSRIDDVIINLGGQLTNVPNAYTRVAPDDTNVRTLAYTFPPIYDTEVKEGTITIDFGSTDTAAMEAITPITIYTNNYYVDEKAGGAFAGPAPEDEDRALTQGGSTISRLYFD